MTTIASQITSLTSVYSTVYTGADQSKHQSSASLAFVHKLPVTRKMFHLMTSSYMRQYTRQIVFKLHEFKFKLLALCFLCMMYQSIKNTWCLNHVAIWYLSWALTHRWQVTRTNDLSFIGTKLSESQCNPFLNTYFLRLSAKSSPFGTCLHSITPSFDNDGAGDSRQNHQEILPHRYKTLNVDNN